MLNGSKSFQNNHLGLFRLGGIFVSSLCPLLRVTVVGKESLKTTTIQ
jgi:hypothetical protein